MLRVAYDPQEVSLSSPWAPLGATRCRQRGCHRECTGGQTAHGNLTPTRIPSFHYFRCPRDPAARCKHVSLWEVASVSEELSSGGRTGCGSHRVA